MHFKDCQEAHAQGRSVVVEAQFASKQPKLGQMMGRKRVSPLLGALCQVFE